MNNRGYTLVEILLSVSFLVLMTGSIIHGHELLQNARVEFLNLKINKITSAWHTFKARYKAIPGDYQFAPVNIDSVLLAGNGNGLIDTDIERGQVWAHLQAAGLIDGLPDDGSVSYDQYDCAVARCLDNGYGHGFNLTYANEGQTNPNSYNELLSGTGIPIYLLKKLDEKIDDGLATTGKMQLATGGSGWSEDKAQSCLTGMTYNLEDPKKICAAVFRFF